ncbi:hypothetical protein A3Q56_04328 [Intoshia linei]|uniref:Uncharacterized protein n=1 Tax=Intoshia linei TaxID=1819745 RepID=A0A177B2W7_9BILA|nr:hypothetical protein A3Q56_04328 [Intoshia linei]
MSNIPKLGQNNLIQTRRFITFIDVLYDNKNIFIFHSQREAKNIFEFENNSQDEKEMITLYGDLDQNVSSNHKSKDLLNATKYMFGGDEEKFSIVRTKSRLHEMMQESYYKQSMERIGFKF